MEEEIKKETTENPSDKENQETVEIETKETEVAETEEQIEERLQKDLSVMNGLSSEGIGFDDEEENSDVKKEVKEQTVVKKQEKNDPVDDLLERTKKGMQKRIDTVVAQKGELATKNTELESKVEKLERELNAIKENKVDVKQERVYTYEELDSAYERAVSDNDIELMKEIRKHERENIKRDLRKEYSDTLNVSDTEMKRINSEWKEIQNNFIVYSDESQPELYPGSRNELNISNPDSKLFQLAKAKYQTDSRYKRPNGMVQAVADAFREIITIRVNPNNKTKLSKEEVLVNKVKKANLKTSQGSSTAMRSETQSVSKPKSKSQELSDYIAERRRLSGVA